LGNFLPFRSTYIYGPENFPPFAILFHLAAKHSAAESVGKTKAL